MPTTHKKPALAALLAVLAGLLLIAVAPAPSASSASSTCPTPTNLAVTSKTDTSVSLAWDAVTGATRYDVYAAVEPDSPTVPHATGVTEPAVTLTGLSSTTSYNFAVAAVCVSDPSNTATAQPVEKATTRPVGSAPLPDAEAASRVTRSTWEPRPENATPNNRVPTAEELADFRAANTAPPFYKDNVTGNFTGTTDEIIQWAAHKWGVDEDVVRASAVQESWWYMSALGDGGISYGLMQIKSTAAKGTHPLSELSTAFNVDYFAASIRYYFDGQATWLNGTCCFSGTTYEAGDLWGSVGAWFSGRWYTDGAVDYIDKVKARLAERRWRDPSFASE